MTLTLAIDDRIAEEALKVARARGTSLDQMVREALERITATRPGEELLAELESQWQRGGGRSGGSKWDREELYDRSIVR